MKDGRVPPFADLKTMGAAQSLWLWISLLEPFRNDGSIAVILSLRAGAACEAGWA